MAINDALPLEAARPASCSLLSLQSRLLEPMMQLRIPNLYKIGQCIADLLIIRRRFLICFFSGLVVNLLPHFLRDKWTKLYQI